MVGQEEGDKGRFDSLRQRLESERGEGASTGILAGETGGQARQRRTLGEMIGGQFGARE